MRVASDDQLEGASSSCERWGIGCAGFVVVGVIAEFVIAGIHPLYDSFLEQWGSAIADAVIAVGIVGEVAFGMWDSRIQTELRKRSNKKLSDAVERAANLEKEAAAARERVAEIEKLTAFRHVSEEQQNKVAAVLNEIAPSLDIWFEYQNGDVEAFSYMNEIAKIFEVSGVVKPMSYDPNLWMMGGAFGLAISIDPQLDEYIVTHALENADIDFVIWPWAPLKMHKKRPPPNLYVYVLPKPPPSLLTFSSDEDAATPAPNNNNANAPAATLEEALRRAAAIERHAAPRRVTGEQRATLVHALRDKLPLTYEQTSRGKQRREEADQLLRDFLIVCFDDVESRLFSSDLIETFKLAKAGNAARTILEPRFGDLPSGLYVLDGVESDLVREILSDAGLLVERDAEMGTRLSKLFEHHARSGLVRLYVGHKPPPMDSSI